MTASTPAQIERLWKMARGVAARIRADHAIGRGTARDDLVRLRSYTGELRALLAARRREVAA